MFLSANLPNERGSFINGDLELPNFTTQIVGLGTGEGLQSHKM